MTAVQKSVAGTRDQIVDDIEDKSNREIGYSIPNTTVKKRYTSSNITIPIKRTKKTSGQFIGTTIKGLGGELIEARL